MSPRRVIALLASAVLAVLAGCAPRVEIEIDRSRHFHPPPDTSPDGWWPCPVGGAETRECRLVHVPQGGPGSATVALSLSRLPARDPERRVGALVLAPGGPGLSGLQEALAASLDYPAELRDRFDIVGFDRRGVGLSGRVDCGEPKGALDKLRHARDLGSPRTFAAVDADARAYVEGCRMRHGELLGHLGSRAAADDLEAVRVALGEEKISLLMHSYSTIPGQLYVAQHPDRVRSAVFDGVVDPGRRGTAMALRTLHSPEELDDEHVPVPPSRDLPEEVREAFATLDPGKPPLALFLSVHCADFPWPDSVPELLRKLAALRKSGQEAGWRVNTVARDYAACVHWPGRGAPLGAVRPASAAGDSPQVLPLLINSRKDMRTPLAGAERVANRFHAPLLTVRGGQHGLVGYGNRCAEKYAVEHLTGRLRSGASERLTCG
ncbi:alpha/beta hydrolase [Streptomyces sp. A7024]|uniref:Alpha/beta hydrolase n=1 Tax=Streptomyces coryli TaxID=1128680 RepID=A0A6G4U246_9ACTN|nr:alpha/beta hydrolase [Streptomyces coryli]NGN65357.1 alpha/beta hydrolase [Streptomyces coryli]